MIGVTGTAIGSPCDHGIRMEPLQLSGDAIREAVEQRAIADVVAEFAIGKAQKDWRPNAECICRALRLFAAAARARSSPRNPESGRSKLPVAPAPCAPSVATIRCTWTPSRAYRARIGPTADSSSA
jgi:hypothetical protein